MEIGWSELLVIGVVALVVIGPKDLPEMFRTLGRFTAKLRSMAREFSRAMEDAAKESGVKDVADDLRKATNPRSMGLDAVKSAADRFEKWDPLKAAKSTVTKPAGAEGSPAPDKPAGKATAEPGDQEKGATVADATPAPAADAKVPDAAAVGPNTAALAEKVATRRAAAARTTTRLREAAAEKKEAATAAKAAAKPSTPKPDAAGSAGSGAARRTKAGEEKTDSVAAKPPGRRRKPAAGAEKGPAPAGKTAAPAAASEK